MAGTPGESYLASRGIPIDIATVAGVRYLERWQHWTRDERGDWRLEGTSRRVVFPIVDTAGELIGIQGRKIAEGECGEKMLTNGRGGIFVVGSAWPLPEQIERVAIVEAPIDAEPGGGWGGRAGDAGHELARVAAAGAGVQEGAAGARQ